MLNITFHSSAEFPSHVFKKTKAMPYPKICIEIGGCLVKLIY